MTRLCQIVTWQFAIGYRHRHSVWDHVFLLLGASLKYTGYPIKNIPPTVLRQFICAMSSCEEFKVYFCIPIENSASFSRQAQLEYSDGSRLPKITSASCDLDLWPTDPWGRPFMPLTRGKIYVNLHWNQSILFRSLAFTRLSNKRTDERTKGQVEKIMRPAMARRINVRFRYCVRVFLSRWARSVGDS